MKSWISATVFLFALTACSGSDEAPAGDEPAAIETAAQAYSDAYLTGDADSAYALLSARCQDRMTPEEFGSLVTLAASQYGDTMPFKSFDADVNGEQARVTYTYDMAAINQSDEPWVKEDGDWLEDDC